VPDFRGISGALVGLKLRLEQQLPVLASLGVTVNVRVLDSSSLNEEELDDLPSNTLAIYLHRISVEPIGAGRTMPPPRRGLPRQVELPINLHLLLVAVNALSDAEASIMGWAIQQIGTALDLDHALLVTAEPDAAWHPDDKLQVFPEPMNTEDLLRIWDGLPADYRLSTPYIIKNLRLLPAKYRESGPVVSDIEYRMAHKDLEEQA
jgi:hypothetical protein